SIAAAARAPGVELAAACAGGGACASSCGARCARRSSDRTSGPTRAQSNAHERGRLQSSTGNSRTIPSHATSIILADLEGRVKFGLRHVSGGRLVLRGFLAFAD